jgi:hypothetical protein
MKKTIQLLVLLAALSAISGYLMSQMSFIGRLGINMMHHEYKFLKVWWQGAIVVYAALLVLFALHAIINKALPFVLAKLAHIILLVAAFGGMYFTYSDFSDDFTHRLLKQRFHIGAYLFWIGWMLISVFYVAKKKKIKLSTTSNKMAATNEQSL